MILNGEGFGATKLPEEADLLLINTCSIREKAEQTVRTRLHDFKKVKNSRPGMLIGILGCMAERLKAKLIPAIAALRDNSPVHTEQLQCGTRSLFWHCC